MSRVLAALFAIALGASGCSVLPRDDGRLRVAEVERAVLPMARAALNAGQTETAGRLYGQLLDADPESFAAHMGLGDVALAQGDAAAAADWHLAALAYSQSPQERHEALLAHGRAALDAGRLEEARDSFQQLTEAGERAPAITVAWGYNGVGLTLLLEGNLTAAIAAMEQAVRRAPAAPQFRDNLERALDLQAELGSEAALAEGAAPSIEPAAPSIEPTAAEQSASSAADADEPAQTSALDDRGEALADATADGPEAPLAEGEPTLDAPDEATEADPAMAAESAAAPAAVAPVLDAFVVTENGERYLQLGSYRSAQAAEQRMEALQSMLEAPVFIAVSEVGAAPMYRVHSGPIESDAMMRRMLETLGAKAN